MSMFDRTTRSLLPSTSNTKALALLPKLIVVQTKSHLLTKTSTQVEMNNMRFKGLCLNCEDNFYGHKCKGRRP